MRSTHSGANATFGTRLRQLRVAAGLTQDALAERAGLSLNAISALERGERRHPYPRTVQVLADALGISENERSALTALLPRRVTGISHRYALPFALPVPNTPLFGREQEIEEAIALLRHSGNRLLTLTGPGGVGKTRLALRVALELKDEFADGALFVSLAPITDAGLVPSAIAQALELKGAAETSPRDMLLGFLHDRELLLVLDNFEQVPAAGPVIAEALAACPHVTVIVTSRRSLRVDGEQEFPVSPLSLPEYSAGVPLSELALVPAVALFQQRARLVRPTFSLTEDNVQAVMEICARLDGVPLAIELAAARIKVLSPQAIVRRLDDRLSLLTGGGRDRPERLQTMRGAISWSFDHLGPDERMLFCCLCVFAGGATLDAATVVAGQPPADVPSPKAGHVPPFLHSDAAILDGIAALADHSLLLLDEGRDGELRIRMLEIIREYGLEQLAAIGEQSRIQRAHAEYFLTVAIDARERIEGPDRQMAHAVIQQEMDNCRAALRWLHAAGDAEFAQRLANELARFWIDLGFISEGREWMERAIAMTGPVPPVVRAESLYWAAGFANLQDAQSRATMLGEEALALARSDGNRLGEAMALTELASAAAATDLECAHKFADEALTIFRDLGDPIREGLVLRHLGIIAHRQGDFALATDYHTSALSIWRRLDHPWGIPAALRELADAAIAQGDLVNAQAQYEESLYLWRKLGERLHMSDCLSGLARVALASDQGEQAALLLGAKDALDRSMGYVSPRDLQAELVEAASATLSEPAFAAAWAMGQSLPLEDVLDEVASAS